ncbi:class I SAM-dependent methyltransferase [Streptomyces sp. AJS327]|uniref:class I SAM-dependent methyltransferase n=1 Tax=Streptomyces sp. AJS327 TaxID=2545265 RepID=UPI0015DFE0D5|nr:class I SAM-dependent methyltransferase [Streptomyces sp. AJS327]
MADDRLPGLESVAPHDEDGVWLHDALLGPYSADIVEYLGLARATGGPVLDLGSGGGRLTVPLARHGFTVEAVDADERSLERLRAWAARGGPRVRERVTTTRADLTALRLRRPYRLALLAGAVISAVPPGVRFGLLREVAGHLAEGGLLAFDFTDHEPSALAERPYRGCTFQVPRFDGVAERVVARQAFDVPGERERVFYRGERLAHGRLWEFAHSTEKWLVRARDVTAELSAAGLRIAERREQPLGQGARSVLLVCQSESDTRHTAIKARELSSHS